MATVVAFLHVLSAAFGSIHYCSLQNCVFNSSLRTVTSATHKWNHPLGTHCLMLGQYSQRVTSMTNIGSKVGTLSGAHLSVSDLSCSARHNYKLSARYCCTRRTTLLARRAREVPNGRTRRSKAKAYGRDHKQRQRCCSCFARPSCASGASSRLYGYSRWRSSIGAVFTL